MTRGGAQDGVEFVPLPAQGRRYSLTSVVRLSDTTPRGDMRLDGVVRCLQDVATDDWDSSGVITSAVWVARRTAVRWVSSHWPQYLEHLTLTTWCAGTGAAWAERRTNIYVGDELLLEAVSLWVPIDQRGFPMRIMPEFHDVYGEAMQGRKVPGRVVTTTPSSDAATLAWPVRRADLDVVGHVNNAAVWQALAEVVDVPVASASVIHHGPIEADDPVQLRHTDEALWLVVGDDVRVAARFRRHLGDSV